MAIALNDILEIILEQVLFGQQILNVFHYEVTALTGTPTYDEVGDAFVISVVDDINALQSDTVSNVKTVIRNLTNGIDISEEPNSATGDQTNPSGTSILAFGYRLVRATGLTRHGGKRIAGVPESAIDGNELNTAFLFAANNVETALGSDVVVDGAAGDATLSPVIVGRTLNLTTNKYELDLSKINPVVTADFIRITSQTTRRKGRGS